MPHFRQGIKNIPEICAQFGVRNVVIAPGSRNAPLIFAFTAHPDLECLSITDERSAAYFALGMAQQTRQAVALVCTSGTAALNFAPAIAEAYYLNIPLLVLTADRPAEMIDQADGQTIRQTGIFANYIKADFQLPVETAQEADLHFSDRQVSQAIDTALMYPQGPVHVNVPLREPIYTSLPDAHSHPKVIKTWETDARLSDKNIKSLFDIWSKQSRKMVIFGISSGNEEWTKLAIELAAQPDTIVVAENLSNVSGEHIITQPEPLFSSINALETASDFAPELVVTIGHSVICKQLKLFLRKHRPVAQWQFESSMPYVDTYGCLTDIFPCKAADILPQMLKRVGEGDYASLYQKQMKKITALHASFVEQPSLSDMAVTRELLHQIPEGTALHLANSTSVRWTQLFPSRPDLKYYCNRGTSGIDGSLSTAAGFAYASKQPTVFLTGDLSFIYDSNGLWNNYIGGNLKIVVMNNNGGNIFRFIGDKELMANSIDFFTTPHHVEIKSLAAAYGIAYMSCDTAVELEKSIGQFLQADKATVLEIMTDCELNTENYRGYFQKIKEK